MGFTNYVQCHYFASFANWRSTLIFFEAKLTNCYFRPKRAKFGMDYSKLYSFMKNEKQRLLTKYVIKKCMTCNIIGDLGMGQRIFHKILAFNMYCSCPFKVNHCLSSGSSSSWSSSIFSISWREHPQVTCTTSLTLLLHDVVQLQGDLYYINLLICSVLTNLQFTLLQSR